MVNKDLMKKTKRDMRTEYDFAAMKGGIRGKYAKRYREGTNLVLLEPDVSEAFPTDKAVNQALRGILKTTRTVRSTSKLASKSAHPTAQRRTRSKRGQLTLRRWRYESARRRAETR